MNLEFDGEFDVEPEYDNDRCLYDYIEIRQRYSSAAEEVVGRFCGLEPPVLPPLAGPVYIEFFTDHVITGYGWILEWETRKLSTHCIVHSVIIIVLYILELFLDGTRSACILYIY